VEVVDSCSNTIVSETPLSKAGLKRSLDNITTGNIIDVESGEESITKPVKLVVVKIESDDLSRETIIWCCFAGDFLF